MLNRLPTHFEHYSRSAYAPYIRQHRLAGSVGEMLEVAQPPGDFSDPPTSDFCVIRAVSNGIHQSADLGGGRFEGRSRSGDLFVVAPATATDILVHNDHVIRVFAFAADALRAHIEQLRPGTSPFDFGRLHAGAFRNPLVLGLLDRLWDASDSGDPTGRLFAEGAALAIVAELARQSQDWAEPRAGGLTPWQIKRADAVIRDRIADDLPLVELAAEVRLSPYHFARAFKVSTGLPPHRYQMTLRVERAKELLTGTRQSVTEIAHACGFASSQHMATVFRRAVGATPTEYRRQRRC
ncbi:MAG: helix-turn-helix domain-containing protein [Pseudomonadota bacterium]